MSSPKSITQKYPNPFNTAFSRVAADQNYLNNPDSDFSKSRILSKESVLKMAYRFTSQSLQRFILNIPDIPNKSISPSAISQARDKVKYDFYKNQFHLFNCYTNKDNTSL